MASKKLTPLPEAFLERLRNIIPSQNWDICLDSFSSYKTTAFRINTLKTTSEAVVEQLIAENIVHTPHATVPNAFIISPEYREALTHSNLAVNGHIYIQNLSSQLAAHVLAPQPGETVLDLAAAPGGKTLHLAALMNNDGVLSAVEAIRNRFFKLRANIEKHGVTIAKTYLMDGRAVGRKTPERFDRILLDAPCSSEARFTQLDPKSWEHWKHRKIKETSRKQKGLLRSALQALKPGGKLLYCTCSFAPEENECVINEVLSQDPDIFQIDPINITGFTQQAGLTAWNGEALSEQLQNAIRILPDKNVDAFFMCLLTKR